ncbi:VOC family protein [Niallia sp. 03133]|uniref:VOC family protein n=1 Tax=Niallia sp. 03133 TaxID=3458060 RepID=UPI0040444547
MRFHSSPNIYTSSVVLKVKNLEQSILFYKTMIGFKIKEKSDDKAVLTADGKSPLVYLEQLHNAEPKKARTAGLYHFALLVPTREDLGMMLKHLLQSGYPIQGASDHNVNEAIYLADPDGNGIEIYRDLSPEKWEWNNNFVKMDTLPLDAEGVLEAGNTKQWDGLPAETILGHIHLHVAELEQTVRFYVEGLGFKVVQKYGEQAYFISTGNYHHHLGLNIWNGIGASKPKENSTGLKYFELKVPSLEVLHQIETKLKEMNVAYQLLDHILYTEDPSGNAIRMTI